MVFINSFSVCLFFSSFLQIGICGRTGSGKSSLALSLFGVLQVSRGCIRIDDNDIAHIHPDEIRTRLSIIPQDVHLFNMTIRENLDPSGYYSDLELWNCLELAQLKDFVNSKMPQGLGMYRCVCERAGMCVFMCHRILTIIHILYVWVCECMFVTYVIMSTYVHCCIFLHMYVFVGFHAI